MSGSKLDALIGVLHQPPPEADEALVGVLSPHLASMDSLGRALLALRTAYPPEESAGPGAAQRWWELVGRYYCALTRHHDAIAVYRAAYAGMLDVQEATRRRVHKGMPLCWMSDCYLHVGFPFHARRHPLYTMCEDAVQQRRRRTHDWGGSYWRLVMRDGVPHAEYEACVAEIRHLRSRATRFPEAVLQEIQHRDWMYVLPAPSEVFHYRANTHYVRHLMQGLGKSGGKALELLAEYLMSCLPGCRTRRNARTLATEYDVLCAVDGFEVDFRSEFGRYFICECKDWNRKATFAVLAKFGRVLQAARCRFGILFSGEGVTGTTGTTAAAREQLMVFHGQGTVIAVVSRADLDRVADEADFMALLRSKYESVRLDLPPDGGDTG